MHTGKADIELTTGNRTCRHTVAVVKHFSHNFLLRKNFLLKNKANVDFSSCSLTLSNVELDFVAPKERKLVATVADCNIAARSTVAIQTQLSTDSMISSDMLIEGGFAKDNSYFVAKILTKARPKVGASGA